MSPDGEIETVLGESRVHAALLAGAAATLRTRLRRRRSPARRTTPASWRAVRSWLASRSRWRRRPGSSASRTSKPSRTRTASNPRGPGRIWREAANGTLASVPVSVGGGSDARIVGGDEREAEVRFGGGSARLAWSFLRLADFHALAAAVAPSASEWFALGGLCLDAGLETEGMALGRAYKDPRSREAIDRLIASRRGVDVPEGGFVLHKGVFVAASASEKATRGESVDLPALIGDQRRKAFEVAFISS